MIPYHFINQAQEAIIINRIFRIFNYRFFFHVSLFVKLRYVSFIIKLLFHPCLLDWIGTPLPESIASNTVVTPLSTGTQHRIEAITITQFTLTSADRINQVHIH